MKLKRKVIENFFYIAIKAQKYYVQICKLMKESSISTWHYFCVRIVIVAWMFIQKSKD